MNRFARRLLRGCAAAAAIGLAAVVAPSAGWPRTTRLECRVDQVAIKALKNWGAQLAASSPQNPAPIVDTYEIRGVLLPTCAKGPLVGRAEIKGYFIDFLKQRPVVAFDWQDAKIGGNCHVAFASGLYTFTLEDKTTLPARYTYIFRRSKSGRPWLIAQHHSSLQPGSGAACPH